VDPPGRWAELYRNRLLPPINYRPGEVREHPDHQRRLVGTLENEPSPWRDREIYFPEGRPDMRAIDEHRRLYYGLAAYCDAQIGRLIAFLDRTGLSEKTLVIFTSDHGITLFDHGFYDKHCFYDPVWRVPMIMRMPGTLPAGEKRDFAMWTDITATILAAAQAGTPFVQGFDLFYPLVAGQASPRCCAVATLYKSCALATKRWKLEYYFEEGTGRLFDRLQDPDEQEDLFQNAAHREVREALLQALLTWRADQMDLQDLVQRTTAGPNSGGPVARRIARYTRSLRGADAERRLNERAEEIDAMQIDPIGRE
jgi:arylsulfatase A-like enzyme